MYVYNTLKCVHSHPYSDFKSDNLCPGKLVPR